MNIDTELELLCDLRTCGRIPPGAIIDAREHVLGEHLLGELNCSCPGEHVPIVEICCPELGCVLSTVVLSLAVTPRQAARGKNF